MKYYVRIDQAANEVMEPDQILESDVWDTFEMDQRPFSVVWFDTSEDAERFYWDVINQQ